MNSAFFEVVRASVFRGSLTQPQVDGINAILQAWDISGDGDERKLAYLLGTAFHETARTMQPIYERGQRSYFSKYEPGTKIGKALGNSNVGDGYQFRGRGFVQLTGRFNYRNAGLKMDVDLIGDPDKALRPDIAGIALVRGSLEGWYTGKKLSDYINAAKTDYFNARRVINGTDKAQLIAGYAVAFEAAIKAGKGAPVAEPAPLPIDTPDDHEAAVTAPRKGVPVWLWIVGAVAVVVALVFFTPII